MPDLIVENVTKEYPTRGEPLVVLNGASLSLSKGENVAILGPSGSGKSTLLQIIGTLDRPTSGTVRLLGQSPFDLNEPQLADFRNQNIGFVFQDHHLLPQLSVIENVLLPAVAAGVPDKKTIARADHLLKRVGLTERRDHLPSELSGGERGRVAVARALIRQPALLLADEPTGNLDRATAGVIGELLVELQQQEEAMLVVVTHSQALAELLQQRVELENGQLELSASP